MPTALLSLGAALAFAFFAPQAPTAELIVGTLIAGVTFGTIANVAGHELIHQDDQPARFALGMALEAMALDPADTVGHDLHHDLVATSSDPSSAQRGESYWHFLFRSVPGAAVGAWAMERDRLAAVGRPKWTPGNRLIQAAAAQCAVMGVFWLVGSWRGVAAFLVAGIVARIIVEATKYSSHYGLVRAPGLPVEIRHSWNSRGGVSSRALFNAGWHSDHHVNGERPYREIVLPDNAPINPYPAGLTFMMALVPPVWFAVMDPLVDMWHGEFASSEEQAIAADQQAAGLNT